MAKKKEVKKEVKVKLKNTSTDSKNAAKVPMIRKERVYMTQVVSRNFLADFWGSIQNTFGQNLTVYEKMVHEAINKIEEKIVEREIELDWFRYEITQLSNGAVAVLMYGEKIVR